MKRFALLFGNTDGLEGVKKDIIHVDDYLRSDVGGAWETGEICCRNNLSLSQVRTIIRRIKEMVCDFVFIYFSGHGGMTRSTNLCLNKEGDSISEDEFSGVAKRQLMVFDCCRVTPQVVTNSKKFVFDESIVSFERRRKKYRDRYEKLIMGASPQEIRLYACCPGKEAY